MRYSDTREQKVQTRTRYVGLIFFSPAPRIKLIKNLPVRERSGEKEKTFIRFGTVFVLPPGDIGQEDGVKQCVAEIFLSSPEFW